MACDPVPLEEFEKWNCKCNGSETPAEEVDLHQYFPYDESKKQYGPPRGVIGILTGFAEHRQIIKCPDNKYHLVGELQYPTTEATRKYIVSSNEKIEPLVEMFANIILPPPEPEVVKRARHNILGLDE